MEQGEFIQVDDIETPDINQDGTVNEQDVGDLYAAIDWEARGNIQRQRQFVLGLVEKFQAPENKEMFAQLQKAFDRIIINMQEGAIAQARVSSSGVALMDGQYDDYKDLYKGLFRTPPPKF